jgi:hypothetical protein
VTVSVPPFAHGVPALGATVQVPTNGSAAARLGAPPAETATASAASPANAARIVRRST